MRNAITMVGLLLGITLSACGGDKGDDLATFIGTWQPTAGAVTEICQGYTYTNSLSNLTWTAGVSSDLVQTDGSCALLANVSGATATGIPGQSCSGAASGGTATLTFGGYTFVVSPDGHTATENASGNITYVVDGATIPCTLNETGSFHKIGN